MRHLEDGYLHAIADGEVPSDELVAVREHLEACESCRGRLDEVRNEAETARELIELIEVPAGPQDRLTVGPSNRTVGPTRAGGRWIRPLAWAASLVLAAGIGYMNRPEADAVLSRPLEPTSLGRIDTVFLEVPAREAEAQLADPGKNDGLANAPPPGARAANEAAAPPPASAPARQNAAGARQEQAQESKRRIGMDSTIRLDEVVVTATAEKKSLDTREEDQRASARSSLRANRPAAPSSAPPAETRFMAKAAADAGAVIVTFPRAVELLGGRIKLIEGMVPARLEAVGRTVRVIYLIDEGDLVLAEVAGIDSVNWSLSGPLPVDSLEALRRRVK